jgi:hypothetical protein
MPVMLKSPVARSVIVTGSGVTVLGGQSRGLPDGTGHVITPFGSLLPLSDPNLSDGEAIAMVCLRTPKPGDFSSGFPALSEGFDPARLT